jgi:hypothetical protein
VNNSGAVSPEMRATASKIPVITPARADLSVIDEITRHLGVPSALREAAYALGTSDSMFSVVRITTGTTIKAKASTPAHPEKVLLRATTVE